MPYLTSGFQHGRRFKQLAPLGFNRISYLRVGVIPRMSATVARRRRSVHAEDVQIRKPEETGNRDAPETHIASASDGPLAPWQRADRLRLIGEDMPQPDILDTVLLQVVEILRVTCGSWQIFHVRVRSPKESHLMRARIN